MSCSNLVNSIGLFCDIIGVVLLWHYGLPESINRKGEDPIIDEQIDESEKAKAERYDRVARYAVGLLVVGFVLQLASNFL